MNKQAILIAVVSVVLIAGVVFVVTTKSDPKPAPDYRVEGISYLPLGDSYTIGESVAENERWPNQLAAKLNAAGKPTTIVANPARTGYTTQDLIDNELALVEQYKPDFVTIQIGVNDYVQGVPAETTERNLILILDTLQAKMPQPQQLILVTIPDYGKTPQGSNYGSPAESEAGITNLNRIIIEQATKRGLAVADIFTISQRVNSEPKLTAGDGLHPSGEQYGEWVNIIYPLVTKQLTYGLR